MYVQNLFQEKKTAIFHLILNFITEWLLTAHETLRESYMRPLLAKAFVFQEEPNHKKQHTRKGPC
jgi:hypothetical protein